MPIKNLEVILFISTHCAHCSSTLELLSKAVKQAKISQLTIINLETESDSKKYAHIRSVPYIKIDDFEFTGNLSQTDIDELYESHSQSTVYEYLFSKLFSSGLLEQAEKLVQKDDNYWLTLINLARNENSKMQTRIGVTAIFEMQASSLVSCNENHKIIDLLLDATAIKSHAIRVDLIYFVSIIFVEMQKLKLKYSKLTEFFQKAQNDPSEEIRTIINDALLEITE